MRTIQNQQYAYIFNPWANGKYKFKNESQNGRSWKAMKKAENKSEEIAQRNEFFSFRVLEEYYDFKSDPHALNNLINKAEHQADIKEMQEQLRDWMAATQDPLLEAFDARYDSEHLTTLIKAVRTSAKQKYKLTKRNKHKSKESK